MNKVIVSIRNPLDKKDIVDYTIELYDTEISENWFTALQQILKEKKYLEKNFCFLGFPNSSRNLHYLCNELNQHIEIINKFNDLNLWQQHGLKPYIIEEWFAPETVRFGSEYSAGIGKLGLNIKHGIMNRVHNHFENLQGTVNKLSDYYKKANYETKYSIRQLNNICHEIETLVLSQRKQATDPEWVRPSQITTFFNCSRFDFPESLKKDFNENAYDRKFGEVYLHWSQIGKTLFEVFRDEKGIKIDQTVCDAITHLKYYSGEFDIEWAQDITYNGHYPWHTNEIDDFKNWLLENNFNLKDKKYNFGYHPVGKVQLEKSFGTNDYQSIWKILETHLDIYRIQAGQAVATYDYTWTDLNYKEMQIAKLKPGYDYSSQLQ